MLDLTGGPALVTGGRRGIGPAPAETPAGAGADLVAASARLEEPGSAGHTGEARDRVLEVNLCAPFTPAREPGRGMVERGHGKVIFTASPLGHQGGIPIAADILIDGGRLGR